MSQYLIENYCLKVSIDGHYEPQAVPKLLLQLSVRELYNIMVSPPKESGTMEAIDAYNNTTISDSTIRSIIPPQLKNISLREKVMCGCEY